MDPFEEELMAVEAIFPDFIRRDPHHPRHLLVSPSPEGKKEQFSLRLVFPNEYPDGPPDCSSSVGISQALVSDVIQTSWLPGELCLYAVVDKLRDILMDDPEEAEITTSKVATKDGKYFNTAEDDQNGPEFVFAISQPIVDRKSTFIGRAIEVHSREEAKAALLWLKRSDKKVARATHNMVAWRLVENGILVQDNDDDGEDAAGGRLAHLLNITDVKNVMVVVSRWYGGIMLHGDRFKHISNAARDALQIGGFLTSSQGGGSKRNPVQKGKKVNK